jgi:hypothetical protein
MFKESVSTNCVKFKQVTENQMFFQLMSSDIKNSFFTIVGQLSLQISFLFIFKKMH